MRWRKQWPFDFKWTKDNASLIGLCHDYWADCLNQREFHYNRFGVSRVVCGGHLRLLSDGDHTAVNTGARRWWRFSSRTVSLHQARGWTGPKYRYSSFPSWPARDWNPACQLQWHALQATQPIIQSHLFSNLHHSSFTNSAELSLSDCFRAKYYALNAAYFAPVQIFPLFKLSLAYPEPSPESLQLGVCVCVGWLDILKIW